MGWKRVDEDTFREALLQSEVCNPKKRPGTVEEYFNAYRNTLQSLADAFAPVRRVIIRCQRLAKEPTQETLAQACDLAGFRKLRNRCRCDHLQNSCWVFFDETFAAVLRASNGNTVLPSLMLTSDQFPTFNHRHAQGGHGNTIEVVLIRSAAEHCAFRFLTKDYADRSRRVMRRLKMAASQSVNSTPLSRLGYKGKHQPCIC